MTEKNKPQSTVDPLVDFGTKTTQLRQLFLDHMDEASATKALSLAQQIWLIAGSYGAATARATLDQTSNTRESNDESTKNNETY